MSRTIGEIIDWLSEGADPAQPTVDRLDPGSRETAVTGIVTAFSASQTVIERALTLGANFIISHEGVYYSHQGETGLLQGDPVFMEKAALIARSGIGIYRFHDAIHRYRPDGIMAGLLRELGWERYVRQQQPAAAILELPARSVKTIAEELKKALGIAYVRAAGDLSMPCSRIGVLVGYRGGGSSAIPLFHKEKVDLVIAGEGPEWETPEYVKDAVHQGRSTALIMLGHAESEAPGMKDLADRLTEQFPELPVYFIKDQPVFQII
ncbi:metal-binding protein [compost metagenome]